MKRFYAFAYTFSLLILVTLTFSPNTFAQDVSIPDQNLAAAVRETLDLAPDAPITNQALQRLVFLDAYDRQITNLTGLEHATQLERLGLDENQISNIKPLAGLTQLEALHIGGNQINNQGVQLLTKLTGLKWLFLHGNKISNIKPLANLTQLESLWLNGNQISDVTPLTGLTNLEILHLQNNSIRDISPLVGLTKLTELRLEGNPITDRSPLRVLGYPDKITGPWLWMIAPALPGQGGAASINFDSLSAASGGSVIEAAIAAQGATEGDRVGNFQWTLGEISATGSNNITETLNQIGMPGEVDHYSSYALFRFTSDTPQNNVIMRVGSDDAIKVWLNGNVVHTQAVNRGASTFQEMFRVDLIAGANLLMVKVSDWGLAWSMFVGINADIQPIPVVHVESANRPPMYWTNTEAGTLHLLIGDEVENSEVQNATSLAVDPGGGKLYWAEKTSDKSGNIKRANLDGNPNVQLIKELTSVPLNIALDTAAGKLYLTNSWGKVQRMSVDGSNFEPNLITGLNASKDLVVDATGGRLYWAEETGESSGNIKRANLDGSNVQLVKVLTSVPLGIALDTSQQKIYVTNGYGKIQRLNTDGKNFEPNLITGLDIPKDVAVDVANSKVYWTEKGSIRRADLSGTNMEDVVSGLASPGSLVLGTSATTPIETPTDPTVPVPYAATDVNQDKKVNKTDLLLVVTALGENPPTNPNFDVNADGTVNIADVLLVIENLDDPVAAAAPANREIVASLDPVLLSTHINILRAENDGSAKYAQAIAFLQGLLASVRPTETQLLANYPNPFNPETWIPYQLAKTSDVKITIYDTRGVVVRQLDLGHQPTGFYTSRSRAAYWDGRNAFGERVASGVYFYQLQTDTASHMRKMLILK